MAVGHGCSRDLDSYEYELQVLFYFLCLIAVFIFFIVQEVLFQVLL